MEQNNHGKQPATNAETAIQVLEESFVAAFNTGNVDAMMQHYLTGDELVVFDVVPRKEYHGADNYRRNWHDFFSHFKGLLTIAITELGIRVEGNLAFSHSIQHVTGTSVHGEAVNRTVRVTDCYCKVDGNWLIVHEHISVPVDITTGKPGATA